MGGCCGSADAAVSKDVIARPYVVKTAAPPLQRDAVPLGIALTGGERFRDMGLLGQGVKVAVIDSGIDAEHPSFDGKVVHRTWYREGTPLVEDDHGTHVAGTIHLMAPEAELYDYRVFGKTGRLGVSEAIAQSIYDAVKAGCHIINMSLGGPFPTPVIRKAVQHAHNLGVILVCAAGNSGDGDPLTNEVSYPASYPECLSIAAVSKLNGLPVAVFSNSNAEVDYAGIGVDVHSFRPGGGFQQMSGTSMASPHVAGLIACLFSNGRIVNTGKKTDALLRDTLNATYTVDIDRKGKDNSTGLGFLTALEAGEFRKLLQKVGVVMAQVH